MKIINKWTAIEVSTLVVDGEHTAKLSYGEEDGPYYSRDIPDTEFDTELKAQEYAFKTNKYGKWLILPIIRFDYL